MFANLVSRFKVVPSLPMPPAGTKGVAIKQHVLAELLQLAGIRSRKRCEEVAEKLLSREEQGTTALGTGFAIPHCRTDAIERPVIVLGIAREGVDWAAMDGKPVRLIFLILVPQEHPDLYLKIVARLSQLVKVPGFVEELTKCDVEREVAATFDAYELKLKLGSSRFAGQAGADPA